MTCMRYSEARRACFSVHILCAYSLWTCSLSHICSSYTYLRTYVLTRLPGLEYVQFDLASCVVHAVGHEHEEACVPLLLDGGALLPAREVEATAVVLQDIGCMVARKGSEHEASMYFDSDSEGKRGGDAENNSDVLGKEKEGQSDE